MALKLKALNPNFEDSSPPLLTVSSTYSRSPNVGNPIASTLMRVMYKESKHYLSLGFQLLGVYYNLAGGGPAYHPPPAPAEGLAMRVPSTDGLLVIPFQPSLVTCRVFFLSLRRLSLWFGA